MATSIQQISKTIEKLITKARAPLTKIPAAILVCSTISRPGLSAMSIAANIISRGGEIGAHLGKAADGSQNISEAWEVIRAQEYVKALHQDARVDSAIALGAIQVAGTVATAAGPGTFSGTNINIPGLSGIIR